MSVAIRTACNCCSTSNLLKSTFPCVSDRELWTQLGPLMMTWGHYENLSSQNVLWGGTFRLHQGVEICLAGWAFFIAGSILSLLVSSLAVSLSSSPVSPPLPHLLNFTKKADWILTLLSTLCEVCFLSGLLSPWVVCGQWLPRRAAGWCSRRRESSDALYRRTKGSCALT